MNNNPLLSALLETFSDNPEAAQTIRLLQLPGNNPEEQAALISDLKKQVYPKLPAGRSFQRFSFWGQFAEKMVLLRAVNGTPEKQAELAMWLLKNAHKRHTAVGANVRFVPQPWDGKK